jgi:1-phosphofructokinase
VSRVFTITLNPAIDQTVSLHTLVPGATHRALGVQSEAGGKGVGVAAVLAGLGVPVSASGWLGADNAAMFEAAFERRGIVDAMVRIPGSTRTNIKLADAVRGDSTDINLPGVAFTPEAVVKAEADLLHLLQATVQPGDWCELAGSLPPGVGTDSWLRIARALSRLGAQLLVDTGGSVLGELLEQLAAGGDPHGATAGGNEAPEHRGGDTAGDDRRSAMPAFIKPNRAELEELVGRPLPAMVDVADAADDLRARGVRQVVVSLGGEGAVIACVQGRWHALPPKVPVATTVGAGDALVAGALAALIEGTAFPQAAVFGMACAAARIQRIAPDLPPRAEIDRLARSIGLQAL